VSGGVLPPGWSISIVEHPAMLLALRLHDTVEWHSYADLDQPVMFDAAMMHASFIRIAAAAWREYRRATAPLLVTGPDGEVLGLATTDDELRAIVSRLR
jgi:hypothetical protein